MRMSILPVYSPMLQHDGGNDHGADVDREGHASKREQVGNERADAHRDGELVSCRCILRDRAMVLFFFLNEQIVGAHHAGLQKILLLDEVIAQGAADERTSNQANVAAAVGNGGGSRYAHVFEHGTERTCRAMATNHGNGASCKADERVNADHIRDRNSDHVLRFDKEEHAEQKNDQGFSAAFEAPSRSLGNRPR